MICDRPKVGALSILPASALSRPGSTSLGEVKSPPASPPNAPKPSFSQSMHIEDFSLWVLAATACRRARETAALRVCRMGKQRDFQFLAEPVVEGRVTTRVS